MRLSKLVLLSCFSLFLAVSVSAKVVFFSNRDGKNNLYVMDDDGNNVKNITDNEVINTQPRWSPDGKHIAFMRRVEEFGERQYDVFLMEADGGNERRLTHHPAFDGGYLTWSPDGRHIAFSSHRTGNGNIHTIDITNGNIEQLTQYNKGDRLRAQEPGWSPDGKKIAYVVGSRFIYIMDADGGNPKMFLDGRTFIREPLWSPDGKRILYSEWTFADGDVVSSRAVVVNLQGVEKHEKALPPGWAMSSKSWMGNTKAILAIHNPPSKTDIFLWDLTTDAALQNLTSSPSIDWTPDWIDDAALDVSSTKKKVTLWGRLKE